MAHNRLPPVTLYGMAGCPHCERALHFLRSESIPHELRVSDPITDNGVMLLTAKLVEDKGESKVVEVNVKAFYPVLWSPLTTRIIPGWKQEEYEQLADAYNRERRRLALDFASAQGNGDGQAAQPAQAQPPAQEAAGVPAMHGMVGGNGNVSGQPAMAHAG